MVLVYGVHPHALANLPFEEILSIREEVSKRLQELE